MTLKLNDAYIKPFVSENGLCGGQQGLLGLYTAIHIVRFPEGGGAQQYADKTDGGEDHKHDPPGPEGADTEVLDQVHK